MELLNDVYRFMFTGGSSLVSLLLLPVMAILSWLSYLNYVEHENNGGKMIEADFVLKRVLKFLPISYIVFMGSLLIGYFVFEPDMSEDANLKIGEHKDVYEVSERFDGLLRAYKKMRYALDDGKFSKEEYSAVVRLGKLMGADYKEDLRVIELSSGEDRILGYDRILSEVETFIKEDNIKVLREFILNDEFANYLSNKDYYLGYDEIKLLKKVVKLLAIVDIDNIDNFIKFNENFETEKLAELEKTHLDKFIPSNEEYNEDVFDLVTGRVLGYVEDSDEGEMFDRLVLYEFRYVMLNVWDDREVSDVEYALFEMYDEIRGTDYTSVLDRLKKYPDSVSVLNEIEELKTRIVNVL